jgi:hypothetical protein
MTTSALAQHIGQAIAHEYFVKRHAVSAVEVNETELAALLEIAAQHGIVRDVPRFTRDADAGIQHPSLRKARR